MHQNQNYFSLAKAALSRARTAAKTPGERGGAAAAVVQMTCVPLQHSQRRVAVGEVGQQQQQCNAAHPAGISYSATGSYARTRSMRRYIQEL